MRWLPRQRQTVRPWGAAHPAIRGQRRMPGPGDHTGGAKRDNLRQPATSLCHRVQTSAHAASHHNDSAATIARVLGPHNQCVRQSAGSRGDPDLVSRNAKRRWVSPSPTPIGRAFSRRPAWPASRAACISASRTSRVRRSGGASANWRANALRRLYRFADVVRCGHLRMAPVDDQARRRDRSFASGCFGLGTKATRRQHRGVTCRSVRKS